MATPTASAEQKWRRRALAVAARVNAGWWLAAFLPVALALSFSLSVLILIARTQQVDVTTYAPWLAVVVALGALYAWYRTRKLFFRRTDALVRLDAENGLNNRLTCAADGVGSWPEYDARVDAKIRWRWTALLTPLGVAMACLFAAAFVPIGRPVVEATLIQEPSSWTRVEEWVDTLREEEVAADESLKQIEEQLAALRRQPQNEWYQHNSIEAGDHLREQTEQSIRDLDRDLAMAAAAMAQAAQAMESGIPLDAETMNALQQAWNQSLKGLKSEPLSLNPEMLKALQKMDLSKLKQLSKEELKDIQDKLAQCKMCSGKCLGQEGQAALLAMGMQPGKGGISRGPGTAPLTLSDTETGAETKTLEGVSNTDLRQAAFGDVIGEQVIEHDLDKTQNSVNAGGGLSVEGGAGETVWRNETNPDEQAVLQKYFHE